MNTNEAPGKDFIRHIVATDVEEGRHGGRVQTRFPPEPNGYLHIGHAKAICLDFEIAQEFNGQCYMRFDDTNPEKEDIEYVEAIKEDVRWLGYDWGDRLAHASDYFQELHDFAINLIESGKAYVDSLSAEEIRMLRGTLTEPGKSSPFRNRSVNENLQLFSAMERGEFEEGEHVLRAKIDMASPILICVTQLFIVFERLRTSVLVINGAFIQCTILPTRCRMRWKGQLTHSVH